MGHRAAALPPRRVAGRVALGGGSAAGNAGRAAPHLWEAGMPMRPRRTTRAYVYLQVAGRLMYVPSALAQVVGSRVEVSQRFREALEEISGINVELLSRRELA